LRPGRLLFGCLAVCVGVVFALAMPATGQQSGSGKDKKASTRPSDSRPAMPVYRPPVRGKPVRTVGGGSRGSEEVSPPLALVPQEVAQTHVARPSLFWYVDRLPPGHMAFAFTLMDEDSIEPLIDMEIPVPAKPGVQRIRLADQGVDLQPGIEYEWTISLVVDREHRSSDIMSNGYIDRVDLPAGIELSSASVHAYAEAGLWYDALGNISDAIERDPGNAALISQRDALLQQVGFRVGSN
jgi:hypothetical protein